MALKQQVVLPFRALCRVGLLGLSICLAGSAFAELPAEPDRPNIILAMADDLGWGDAGYQGHPFLRTPNLDAMAAEGLRFNRFYSGAPVCSPTRGSALTGRHPYRYGITFANVGHMPSEEITLAELLKQHGYVTGHFGKWHLGTLTTEIHDSNRGRPGNHKDFSPPWKNGFDVCFSTEAKVPTYNPMKIPGTDRPYGTYYWKSDGSRETQNLEGDDSRIIMDRVIPFIREAVAQKKPFFAVVWFHAPHLPVVAGPEHRAVYENIPGAHPDYHGCITAMDEQIGRLREELRRLGVAENTMLWFCSDNGPEGKSGKAPGSAGPLRGRKRDLFEGGIRVPGLLVWPARIKEPRVTDVPCCTSDYLPTILEVLGLKPQEHPLPLDGVSLLPLIEGRMTERPRPIGFQSAGQLALIDNRYKIIRRRPNEPFMLFDLKEDPGEKVDLAGEHPEIVERMKRIVLAWQAACARSAAGADYAD